MSVSPPTARSPGRIARRQSLVDAALVVFSVKGVSAASVDDIVQAAGVAKGTFYLYFATKDAVVDAAAAWLVEGVANQIEILATAPDRSPIERLLALATGIGQVGGERHERDLIELFHRPENRAIHDRISEQAVARLAPIVAAVVADGIEASLFRPQDPRHAAAYVMACFGSLHEVVSDPSEVRAATDELNTFVLRGLGYEGDLSHD